MTFVTMRCFSSGIHGYLMHSHNNYFDHCCPTIQNLQQASFDIITSFSPHFLSCVLSRHVIYPRAITPGWRDPSAVSVLGECLQAPTQTGLDITHRSRHSRHSQHWHPRERGHSIKNPDWSSTGIDGYFVRPDISEQVIFTDHRDGNNQREEDLHGRGPGVPAQSGYGLRHLRVLV